MQRKGKIVVLTGAGISKESGLSTFRDADGIWSTVRIEDVAQDRVRLTHTLACGSDLRLHRRRVLAATTSGRAGKLA